MNHPNLRSAPEARNCLTAVPDLVSSQARLRVASEYAEAVIQAVPPLLVLDESLLVQTANQSFCKCFKIAPREALGRPIYELGNGQWNIPQLRTLLEEVLPHRSFFKDFEVTHHFEDIGFRTMLLSGRQVDHLQKIVLSIQDITDRRKAEEGIRATHIRYRRLFEAARDGILTVDPVTRKITDANPFMTELLCYPHRELIGKELWEIGLLGDKKANRAAFRELQRKSFIRYENLPLRNKKGQRREVEFVSNLYDEDGRKVIQCNIRDITARKLNERALLTAKNAIGRHAVELERVVAKRTAELRETIRELESFSYSLSHDMRAPLRAMQGFATFVMEEYGQQLDQKGVHYLEQIVRAAVRLDHLIKDVLSYTKILHEKTPTVTVDLNRLVHDIIATLPNQLTLTARNIQVTGVLPKVQANEALLAQCVSNLLSNAVKFVSPGVPAQVEISATASGSGRIRLWFKDNGIGIASADRQRIFRLFERIHPASEYEGTGIGLTIVQKAVERMSAKLGFRSQLGKGSQFWIQLTKA